MAMTVEFLLWNRPDYREALASLGLSSKLADSVVEAWPEPAGLSDATEAQLRRQGLTPAQARRLRGAIDLARLSQAAPSGPRLRAPADVAALLYPLLGMAEHEIAVALMLDRRARLLDARIYSQGASDGVAMAPAHVFRAALRAAAAGVILAHNHPSGNPEPSELDLMMSARFAEIGKLVGVQLLDHVIVARGGGVCSIGAMGGIPTD
jgi:DNA repair protein RadC